MGAINPDKMPGAKKAKRKDGDEFTMYADGGAVGLYDNIHAKRSRIKAGSGEKMRKPGSKGAPSFEDFKKSAKTARK
jgi:hypothetical protein